MLFINNMHRYMESSKILYISQEISPYLPETEMSLIARNLPQGIQERGREIRTFMPKYGCINERRNQLHEVIRLSGMNIIISDTDHPLIIKVASIQTARMQVYFIDNEDYFQRKHILQDDSGEFFDDNDERAIFFARGVIETVKKLQWAPDIVHCHGWFTYLIPLYLRKVFYDDPLFLDTKIILSIYNNEFNKPLNKSLKNKLLAEGIAGEELNLIKDPNYINLNKLAIRMSDAVIMGSDKINAEINKYIDIQDKPILQYYDGDNYVDIYSEFYNKILTEIVDA
jgi:starch synthase